MIRALFLTPNVLLGGVESWFLSLAKYARGVSWSIGLTNPARVDPVMRDQLWDVAAIHSGPSAVKKSAEQSDVVVAWAHERPGDYLGRYAGPVVIVAHGCGAWTRHWIAATAGQGCHYVAVSRETARRVGPPGCRVIANGADLARCLPKQQRDVIRRSWGLGGGEIALGYLGRLSPEKGCHHLARLTSKLGYPYRAVYAGSGYKEQYAKQLGRTDPGAIFAGPMWPGDALAGFDVLCALGPEEGACLATLEAMAASVPVVSTPAGLLPEMEERAGGPLAAHVPLPVTLDELERAVFDALRNPCPRVDMARSIVLDYYTAERMADDWDAYLAEVVAIGPLPKVAPSGYCVWADESADPLVCVKCGKSRPRPRLMPCRQKCGTSHASRPRPARQKAPGPGTKLKQLLAKMGIKPEGCGCGAKAAEWDAKGTAWCRQNVRGMCDWLLAEGEKRGWNLEAAWLRVIPRWAVKLGAPMACRWLVLKAIRQAEPALVE